MSWSYHVPCMGYKHLQSSKETIQNTGAGLPFSDPGSMHPKQGLMIFPLTFVFPVMNKRWYPEWIILAPAGMFWTQLYCILFIPSMLSKSLSRLSRGLWQQKHTHKNNPVPNKKGVLIKIWNTMTCYVVISFGNKYSVSSLSLPIPLWTQKWDGFMGMCLNTFIWIEKCSQIFPDTDKNLIWLVGLTVMADFTI